MPAGTVIRSFAAPAGLSMGLAWDGRTLWGSDFGASLFYQVDPISGTAIRSFATPGAGTRDIAWDGRTLWSVDSTANLIYQSDVVTGTVIKSFATPGGDAFGLAWDGHFLWHSDFGTNLIYQIDPISGAAIKSFATPGVFPMGLTWDGSSLWSTDSGTDRIYQIDPITGSVIRSFPSPNTSTRGIAWDGRTLWASDLDSDLVYQLSVTPGASYADRVLATGPIGYWDQGEQAGTISFDISGNSPLSERDGAYTGVTLAQPGIGDGRTSGLYDGANDYDNIQTASLTAAFNPSQGSSLAWIQMANAGVWTDGAPREYLRLQVNAANRMVFRKTAVNNELTVQYTAGGVTDQILSIAHGGRTDFFPSITTWDTVADQFIWYIDGAQEGAIQGTLGVWVGNLVVSVIGAANLAPVQVWDGWEAHVALWDRALTPAEVLSLGVL